MNHEYHELRSVYQYEKRHISELFFQCPVLHWPLEEYIQCSHEYKSCPKNKSTFLPEGLKTVVQNQQKGVMEIVKTFIYHIRMDFEIDKCAKQLLSASD